MSVQRVRADELRDGDRMLGNVLDQYHDIWARAPRDATTNPGEFVIPTALLTIRLEDAGGPGGMADDYPVRVRWGDGPLNVRSFTADSEFLVWKDDA